jgi:hypothetical protein
MMDWELGENRIPSLENIVVLMFHDDGVCAVFDPGANRFVKAVQMLDRPVKRHPVNWAQGKPCLA